MMKRAKLLVQEIEKFLVGQACLTDNALDDRLGQIETLVVRDRHSAWLGQVLELDVGASGFVDIKTSLLQGTYHFSWFDTAKSRA